jgi:chromate transporter
MTDPSPGGVAARANRIAEVARAFLVLGLTSFGGPIAHLGYFQREFVERRRWLEPGRFAELVALCQFLPGPASSQLGFAIGMLRAGWAGAIAAFIAFTLPSALLLFALASASAHLDGAWGQAGVHGLKLVAVAVVAHGVWTMARALAPDASRRAFAAIATIAVLAVPTAWMPLLAIAIGAVAGAAFLRRLEVRPATPLDPPHGKRTGALLLLAFAAGLALAFLASRHDGPALVQAAAAFYRAGALVFGGGHVVLPMLQQAVVAPGWIDPSTFLAGYGAAQAVPGPMFSLAAFLGAGLPGASGGATGAAVATLALFLPGLLLVAGVLPFWRELSALRGATRALAGINAVVVGLLLAALWNPVWTSTVRDPADAGVALLAFLGLAFARLPPLGAVALCVTASLLRHAVAS